MAGLSCHGDAGEVVMATLVWQGDSEEEENVRFY